MTRQYDYAIIGAGAAGFSAAVKLSELSDGKAEIALVSGGEIGGTCVNVGCVPSKYLIEAAKLYFETKRKRFSSIDVSTKLDFKRLMNDLRSMVSSLRKEKYEDVLKHYGNVELFYGKARFEDINSLKISRESGEMVIKAEKYLVATGSRPHPPPIEGLKESKYLDSDKIWKLEEQPESMLVIGGGAIGLEIGQAMNRLGTKVIIVEALDRILPPAEPEISTALRDTLVEEGVEIYTKARISKIYQANGRKKATILTHTGERVVEAEEILVTTGRKPNTDELGLENVNVELDSRGFIKTDKTMKTSNPRIYAAGDVVAKNLMLETLSAREGVIAAINMAGGHAEMDYSAVPVVTFTEPQAASVGLTERELMERLKVCSCRVVEIENVSKAKLTNEKRGLAKLVINPHDKRIVGIHILSPNASEYILAGVVMIRAGYTVDDVMDTIHVFPSFAESLKLAATAFIRPITAMPCCME